MKNKFKLTPFEGVEKKFKSPLLINVLVFVAYAFFILGAILLFIYSEYSDKPIHIEKPVLCRVILIYAAGYVAVFIKWLSVVKGNDLYHGKADDVPEYLTAQLWGSFPYLGSFGRSNSGNQGRLRNAWHKYQDGDVRGKKFSEIFCLHVNISFIFVAMLIGALLPYMFLNQAAPSYLKFIYSSSVLFTIYMSFIILAWLSAIAIVILRISLSARARLSE